MAYGVDHIKTVNKKDEFLVRKNGSVNEIWTPLSRLLSMLPQAEG
jgi:hypothetical protein